MTTSLTVSDADLDRAIVAEIRGAVAATWRAGRLLAERKRRLQHGQWGAYLDTIGLPARTAQKAMASLCGGRNGGHAKKTAGENRRASSRPTKRHGVAL